MTREARPLAGADWLNRPATQKLLGVLGDGGHPVRFVGGIVRDSLLGCTADKDVDLATPLRPEEVMVRLGAADMKALPTGLSHGTVTAIVDGRPFEITTLRRDVACNGRHAEVVFTDSFEEDAARRDFTINAMNCDGEGRLFDYFGGQDDLKAGRIRFVGKAVDRVREDYLRILRFFRFFAGYGCLPADQEALEACAAAAPEIRQLSGERVRNEVLKLMGSPNPVLALELMVKTGVLDRVLPGEPAIDRLRRLIQQGGTTDPFLRLAALLSGEEDHALAVRRAQEVAAAWRLSKSEATRLETLLGSDLPDLAASDKEARTALYHLGGPLYADLARLAAVTAAAPTTVLERALTRADTFEAPRFPLSGKDLIAAGVAQGPEIGRNLALLEAWWLGEGMRPNREACLVKLAEITSEP